MSIDEGYIKYESHWSEGPPPDTAAAAELERWRRPLHDAGLIGHDAEHDVGYGNLSIRTGSGPAFIITGTQTGHLDTTGPEHYALVTRTDIDSNRVWSTGQVRASSEAMTHAAVYALSATIAAVVHVHSRALWNTYRYVLPTTEPAVAYGTPAMAAEFSRLWRTGSFREQGLAVMAGHDDGILSFGASLEEAAARILTLAGADAG